MTHKVILNGYSALLPGANKSPVIALGTAGSYGIEQLQLAPDARWQGLTITATFHPSAGDPVRVLAGPDNLLDVPPEATATAATKDKPGKIVFAGVSDGVQRISCDLPYIVDTHAAVEGQESSATPDVLAQAIAQTGAARDEAVQAAGEAKEALASIGDSVGRAEAAAERAEQAAANIEGAASAVEAAKTDALTAVGNAKTEAVESVTAAGGKAVESVETVASASVADVNNAKQSALDAITSGKDTALNAVSLAQSSAVQAVQDAQSTGVSAVQGAQSTAETAISEAKTGALENIATEKEAAVKAVNDAGSTATGAIADAKADTLSEIETAKTGAVEAVTAEGNKQAERVQAIFPAVTADDDGKVPIVRNGAWTLGEVAQDAYTRAESDARYAPIESAIRPTANGNPAVCEDSVAWGFQGLKIYGKSTQDGTPSPENPVPIVSAGEGGSVELSVTGNNLFDAKTALASQIMAGVVSVNENGEVILNGTFDPANRGFSITLGPGVYYLSGAFNENKALIWHILAPQDNAWSTKLIVKSTTKYRCYISSGTYSNITTHPMINFGESALPWEPYTGQSLTLSTPSGLLGVPVTSVGNYTDGTGQQLTSDYWDFGDGQQHILCGEIASYNGEEITTPYISSTGALTTGAQVLYVLPEPRTEPIPAEIMVAYRALQTYAGTTVISTAEPVAGIETRYVADSEKWVKNEIKAAVSEAITAAVKLSGGNA